MECENCNSTDTKRWYAADDYEEISVIGECSECGFMWHEDS